MNWPFKVSASLLQNRLREAVGCGASEMLYYCGIWVGLLPRGLEFSFFFGKDMLLCTLKYPSLCLNQPPPPQVYLYLHPSLSKPKTSMPFPNHQHHYLENALHPACAPCFLAFFVDSFFSFFKLSSVVGSCCSALHRSSACGHGQVFQWGEKSFFFFFLFTHTYFPLSCIFPCVYMHNSASLSVSCFSLSPSHFHCLYLSFRSLSPSSFLSFLSLSFSLA